MDCLDGHNEILLPGKYIKFFDTFSIVHKTKRNNSNNNGYIITNIMINWGIYINNLIYIK